MFEDRKHAGILMTAKLRKYKNDNDLVVLVIPRGGVIAGDIIAKNLNAPLEVILVKKIGHPLNKECAIGAVSLDDQIITYPEGVPNKYIENEIQKVRHKMKAQYHLFFFGNRKPISLKGKKVIITDDGVATGNTLLMVIQIVKKSNPDKIIVAIPVAPAEIIYKLQSIVDEVFCLEIPRKFNAVGAHYKYFPQIKNETVIQLLNS